MWTGKVPCSPLIDKLHPHHHRQPYQDTFDISHLLVTYLTKTQTVIMVLQDLGRRINAAVTDLTRAPTVDEKVGLNYHTLVYTCS